MKKFIIHCLLLFVVGTQSGFAQTTTTVTTTTTRRSTPYNAESFGNTLNLGIGVGYYGYLGSSTPVLHADYEFNVARNFTLAPFVTVFSYVRYPNKDYYYRQTVIPFGLKGTYYFDQILNAGPKWDFYLGASLGVAIRKTVWETGYPGGSVAYSPGWGPLYLDGHIGAEYHLNQGLGLFLDVSTGISTFGLAIHF